VRAIEDHLKGLMLRGLDGDETAHRQLLIELAAILRGYFGRTARSARADVEDLVQETLIAVHTRRESYDTTQPFTPWAFAMARYKRIDHFRRSRIRAAAPLTDLDRRHGVDDSAAVEAAFDIEHLMVELPPREREAIRYVKLEGLSVAEAALRSGISEAYVKVSVHRGLRKLMARVRNRENPRAD
jgi:RNA polymerase sigma-70 factor, ECF subfamily